jgi:SNF2-related domain
VILPQPIAEDASAPAEPEPPIARYLPSIEEAFYRAHRSYPSKISESKLPFAQFRRDNGSLYAPATAEIPTFAPPPPEASTDKRFRLGTVLLPVYSVNPEVLSTLDKKTPPDIELEWSNTSHSTVHDYVIPTLDHDNGRWAEQLSTYFQLQHATYRDMLFKNEAPVQLSLGGRGMGDTDECKRDSEGNALPHSVNKMPAVIIRSQNTWVKQFISTLGILEKKEVIKPVYTLVRTGDNEEETGGGSDGGASGSGAEARHKRSLSSPPAGEEKAAITGSASQKKAKVGAKGKAVTKKTPPSKQQQQQHGNKNSKQCPLGLPTHVKVTVYISRGAVSKFYNGTIGDITDISSSTKNLASGKLHLNSCWTQYSFVFGYLLSALLTHGQGTLRLGPDSDGLLNTCDIPKEEAEQVDQMSSQELASQFNVANILNSISVMPELSAKRGLAPVPKGMLSKPKKYQLSGLQWMLDREQKGDARDRGLLALHPAWMQLISESGRVFYIHRIKNHIPSWNFFTAPPQGTCGGFICDEMGLGKSLQTLMLVQQNPPPPNWALEELSPDIVVTHTEPIPIKTTLLVAPTTLLTQWEEEIGKHLAHGVLRYGRFVDPMDRRAMAELMQQAPNAVDVAAVAGNRARRARRLSIGGDNDSNAASGSKPGRGKKAQVLEEVGTPLRHVVCALPDGTAAEIQTLDICLCSYEHLRDQLSASHGNTVSPLQQFGFWRVCLDEAQLIANSSSVAAVMASSLWRGHAWVVTGTPISNRLSEVRGLLEFLALEPYFDNATWGDLVQSGCDDRERHGLLSLRSLLRGVMLRRSKQDVGK